MESEDNRVWNEDLAGRWSNVGTDLGTSAVLSSSQKLSAWGRSMHTGFEVVHSRLKVASSREFIPTSEEETHSRYI